MRVDTSNTLSQLTMMSMFSHETTNRQSITFDARVDKISIQSSSKEVYLGLRVDDVSLEAIASAKGLGENDWGAIQDLTVESLVRVTGHFTNSKDEQSLEFDENGSLSGAWKFDITSLEHIALAAVDLSGASKTKLADLEERLNNRVLDVRKAAAGAIFKLHSGMCQLIVEYLCSKGFHWIHTPRIISATITGDNEYFHLPYFGGDSWLAQSTQHHKQMALSMDMQRVFEIGPVFRAEVKSKASARHLTEFTVLDIGMVFSQDYHEVVEMIESMIVFVYRGLQERNQYRRLIETVKKINPLVRDFKVGVDESGNVPRITFMEAKRILRQDLGFDTSDDKNFTDQEEAALGKYFRSQSRLQTDIFTIDQYPASMRQFNSQANLAVPGLSNTWDIIAGGREACSGSERIHKFEDLCSAMRAGVCGPPLDPEAEKWQAYLAAFKAGMPRHGGCGLGVNRLLQSFLGLDDVREVTMFPRDVNRLAP